MGTSKNVASPDTTPWKPALAVLGRKNVPPARQLQGVTVDLRRLTAAHACFIILQPQPWQLPVDSHNKEAVFGLC